MPSRDQMWGPMSLEEYADRIGEDLSQRPVPLTGLDVLPDVGDLRTARGGDSISSILGTSNPAAIGAFMEANGLKDSGLRAGQSYLIPRRADLADADFAGRGQAALNADNARAQGRERILPGDAVTVQPGSAVLQQAASPKPGAGYLRGSRGADIAGKGLDAFDVQNGLLGLRDKGRAAGILGKVTSPLGHALTLAEGGLEAVGEYKNGAKGADVALGALGKTGIKTLLPVVGGAIGLLSPVPYVTAPILSVAGGRIADKLLQGTSSEAMGKKMQQNHDDAWMRSML